MSDLYIGLMSGTSLDGVDGALMDFSNQGHALLAHAYLPLADALRAELLDLNSSGPNELHRAALASHALALVYAGVAQALLQSGQVQAQSVVAIGAHGQTVRHCPPASAGAAATASSHSAYTIQLNNPALLAELTGIDVVADFRSRDLAAGGQGAPLVPAFHAALFGQVGQALAVLNIGGISNLTLRGPGSNDGLFGFDCGPGNALIDFWCQRHRGAPFDAGGAWAAVGAVDQALLEDLLRDPYFARPAPKSTGRDLFNPTWLAQRLDRHQAVAAVDVQATLTELTARSCADSFDRHASGASRLVVCGGGALNDFLLQRLQARLSGVAVQSSQSCGMHPLHVESAAFAWLASRTVQRLPGNDPNVTGARGARVLGAIYPA